MFRLLVILVTAVGCVGGGAVMGLAAFTSELHWPLSEENFAYAVRLGYTCGSVGALITAVCLLVMDRKRMWMAAPVAVVVTCSITFAGVWWHLISGLG